MSETRRRETREEIVRDMREGAAVFAEKGDRVFADTLAGFAKRVDALAKDGGRGADRVLEDLKELRRRARYIVQKIVAEDSDDSLAGLFGMLIAVPFLVGVRFGCTSCILAVKSRKKRPDGDMMAFGQVWRSIEEGLRTGRNGGES